MHEGIPLHLHGHFSRYQAETDENNSITVTAITVVTGHTQLLMLETLPEHYSALARVFCCIPRTL
jgi:hypothetical protein